MIFAVKVKSCDKLHQILNVFALPKVVPTFSPLPSSTSRRKESWDYTPWLKSSRG